MPGIKIFYIVSLVLLAALAVFVFFQPFGKGIEYSEIQQEQFLETDSEWILQFNIFNNEGEKQNYSIKVINDDKVYTEGVSIDDGGIFAFIHHIQRNSAVVSEVKVLICQKGRDNPLEQLTYYLR